jgi:tRNA threonylcarbamoyladenosine biosynthesis protein TsaB
MILAITTSTSRGGVALARGGSGTEIVASSFYDDELRHAERLFDALDELLGGTGVERKELDAIACDVGPGSFTGVRVGLASAKGIALALGIPVVPVISLEVMALAAFAELDSEVELCAPLLDARRGEIFYAVYDRHLEVRLAPAHATAAAALAQIEPLAQTQALATVGLDVGSARAAPGSSGALPSAPWVARRALALLASAAPPSLDSVEPFYLRPADATPMPS